jgi:hypothetical protein
MTKSGLLTPYRGVRYHVKEYSNNPPTNQFELFNLRHASLRNTIERAFGVLKKRFPIVASLNEPYFWIQTHKQIFVACCILHNYLMNVDPDQSIIREVDMELENEPIQQEDNATGPINDDENAQRGEWLRDAIAVNMWRDYYTS